MSDSEAVADVLCITSNNMLKRTLRTTLTAAGASVMFRSELGAEPTAVALLFIDRESLKDARVEDLVAAIRSDGKIVVLGDTLNDSDALKLLRNENLNHLITDWETLSESELVVTSVKLLSDDIFGLSKYLSWGVKVHEVWIDSYDGKERALRTIAEEAKKLGARRTIIGKIERVAEELLMNALYDAPAVRRGEVPAVPDAQKIDRSMVAAEPALLRFGCDGKYFAISVQDNYGELHKHAILDHVERARDDEGRPKESQDPLAGAGLGMFFILSSATRFIANIERGSKTEVICLLDFKQSLREVEECARSLHIFLRDVVTLSG